MQLLMLDRLSVHTCQVRLVNSRCLNEPTLKVETIDRVYLPDLPSQLTLFFTRQLFKLSRLSSYFCKVRLVNLSCAHSSSLKLRRLSVSTNQLPSQLALLCKTTLKFRRWSVYKYQVCLVNLRCLCETTLIVELIIHINLRSWPSQPTLFAWDSFWSRGDYPCTLTKFA